MIPLDRNSQHCRLQMAMPVHIEGRPYQQSTVYSCLGSLALKLGCIFLEDMALVCGYRKGSSDQKGTSYSQIDLATNQIDTILRVSFIFYMKKSCAENLACSHTVLSGLYSRLNSCYRCGHAFQSLNRLWLILLSVYFHIALQARCCLKLGQHLSFINILIWP